MRFQVMAGIVANQSARVHRERMMILAMNPAFMRYLPSQLHRFAAAPPERDHRFARLSVRRFLGGAYAD
jgi:hypothetical protein